MMSQSSPALRFGNLVDMWRGAAGAAEHVTVVDEAPDGTWTEQRLSYGELYERTLRQASALQRAGVRPGDRVGLVLPTGHAFITLFFAIQHVGAVPMPMYPPHLGERGAGSVRRLSLALSRADARWCVTDQTTRTTLAPLQAACPALSGVLHAEALDAFAGGPPDAADIDPLAFIQYTSGSTSLPKGVCLPHASVLRNVHDIGATLRLGKSDVVVSWVPLYHDLGLVGMFLLAIYGGLPLVLMPPGLFITRPEAWLWAMHRHRGTISAAPNFAYGRCTKRLNAAMLQGCDLSAWRFSGNCGEMCQVDTIRDFQAAFAPLGLRPHVVKPAWGLAEATCAITVVDPCPHTPVPEVRVARDAIAQGSAVPTRASDAPGLTFMSVGRPMQGYAVSVRDEAGNTLGDDTMGEVWVRGASRMRGYHDDDLATAGVFADAWLRTGDLGLLRGGELFLTGRLKDLLIINGRNVAPEDIEWAAEAVSGVRAGNCIAFSTPCTRRQTDSAVLVCETKHTAAADLRALERDLRAAVQDACNVKLGDVALVRPNTLPKTSSGKRQRAECRKRFVAGHYRTGQETWTTA